MSSGKMAIAALVASAAVGMAWACGSFFPWKLLDDRAANVAEAPNLGFEFEMARILPSPSDSLRAVEDRYSPYGYYYPPGLRDETEPVSVEREEALSGVWYGLLAPQPGSPPDIFGQSENMAIWAAAARSASDGESAMVAGAGLPQAVVLYIAGAVEFHAKRLRKAAEYFESIDRLPPEQRSIRAVAAAYMQGRVHQHLGAFDYARAAFQMARTYAVEGAPDPMGLAVASLGEEARIDLAEASVIEVPWRFVSKYMSDEERGKLIVRALKLYADQAARGSKVALVSIREVAGRDLFSFSNLGEELVSEPLLRQVLLAHELARDGQWEGDSRVSNDRPSSIVDALLALPEPVAGDDIDRLAAAAYQSGHYDAAERLTETTKGPLGLWVRAKLALRRDDRAAAVRDWKAALAQVKRVGHSTNLDRQAVDRMHGELAVVVVGEGNYQEALRVLFLAADRYWNDATYIAERVLTVDELKEVVDELSRAQNSHEWPRDLTGMTERLRDLLARRLTREGRIGDALPYYSSTMLRSEDYEPRLIRPIADDARAYAAALEQARPTWPWRNVSRAEGLFNVAMFTRRRATELMGTEGPPDMEALEGGPSKDLLHSGSSAMRAEFIGADEISRLEAHTPTPLVRFHYRRMSIGQALAAAELLPRGSQAYAAALCWAAKSANDSRDTKRAMDIYRHYVATGAYQSWADKFGGTCPQPDFVAARDYWPKRIATLPLRMAKAVGRHPAMGAALAVGAMLILAASVWGIRVLRHKSR